MVSSASPAVFVVDDELSVRKALRRLFVSAGYGVETFASATEFLARDLPAAGCVVLDIRMPGISGLDLQRQLGVRAPRLPVVIITGHGDDEIRQRALDGGAVDVIDKPFDDQVLLDAVGRAFAERSNRHGSDTTTSCKRESLRPVLDRFDAIVSSALVPGRNDSGGVT